MIPPAAITTPTEAADQRLNAAVRDAADLVRLGAHHDTTAAVLTLATLQADRILGHQTRSYPQTFRVGKP